MNIQQTIQLITAIVLTAAVTIATAAEPAKTDAKKPAVAASDTAVVKLTATQRLPKTVTKVTIIDRELGDSASAAAVHDNAILVHYTGWLYDPAKPDGKGVQFDTSRERYTPFGFFIGAGKVIKGWDLGFVGMKIKGKRTLIIPPALAYGDKERPKIPANSTLIFDVELVDILGTRGQPASADTTAAAPATPVAAAPTTVTRLTPQDPLPAAPAVITVIEQATGEGRAAEAGNDVLVHYTGWFYDPNLPSGKGKQFDSSRDRNQLFRFKLGAGRVIRGWDVGVTGMQVKGKRTLIIPADYAYGVRGAGGVIPPNATLIFDVELVELPPA